MAKLRADYDYTEGQRSELLIEEALKSAVHGDEVQNGSIRRRAWNPKLLLEVAQAEADLESPPLIRQNVFLSGRR
jgi:hypothetical protein